MDSYVGFGGTGWTQTHTKTTKTIHSTIIALLRKANYCEFDKDKVVCRDGYLQCRVGFPDQIGMLTFCVEIYCCVESGRFALEVGFQQWYEKHPQWILLPESNVLTSQALRNAWRRCFHQKYSFC